MDSISIDRLTSKERFKLFCDGKISTESFLTYIKETKAYASYYAYQYIASNRITTEQRAQAFEIMVKNSAYAYDFLTVGECGPISEDERNRAFNAICDDSITLQRYACNVHLPVNEYITIAQIAEGMEKYYRNAIFDELVRAFNRGYNDHEFDLLENEIVKHEDLFYKILKSRCFVDHRKAILYRKSVNLFNNFQKSLNKCYDYCNCFKYCITSDQLDVLIKRVIGRKDIEKAEYLLGSMVFKLTEDQKDKLHSLLLINQLNPNSDKKIK